MEAEEPNIEVTRIGLARLPIVDPWAIDADFLSYPVANGELLKGSCDIRAAIPALLAGTPEVRSLYVLRFHSMLGEVSGGRLWHGTKVSCHSDCSRRRGLLPDDRARSRAAIVQGG